jgi:hypothetical protein
VAAVLIAALIAVVRVTAGPLRAAFFFVMGGGDSEPIRLLWLWLIEPDTANASIETADWRAVKIHVKIAVRLNSGAAF